MSSGCMSSSAAFGCVDGRAPVRATYVNLYRWPESDAEFVKSVSRGEQWRRPPRHQHQQHPRVVDSYSCRQMYLRSYTFSKKETVPERTRKCLGRVKEKVVAVAANGKVAPGCVPWAAGDRSSVGVVASGGPVWKKKKKKKKQKQKPKKSCPVMRKLREVSSAALRSVFRRLLSCTAAVDIADR